MLVPPRWRGGRPTLQQTLPQRKEKEGGRRRPTNHSTRTAGPANPAHLARGIDSVRVSFDIDISTPMRDGVVAYQPLAVEIFFHFFFFFWPLAQLTSAPIKQKRQEMCIGVSNGRWGMLKERWPSHLEEHWCMSVVDVTRRPQEGGGGGQKEAPTRASHVPLIP